MFSKRGTLAVACLATAMLMLDIAVVNTALPRIATDLHSGLGGLQWIVDAYTLALATVVLTVGSLADRLGRRRLFAAGTVIFTGASLACALAGSITALDAARAVQGIGAAMLFATSLALIANAFTDERGRGGAFAAYGATIGASFALGPLVGGGLTSALGWRSVFYLNLPLGVAALVATAAWVRESRDPSARPVDWPGQLTLTAGLFLLVWRCCGATATAGPAVASWPSWPARSPSSRCLFSSSGAAARRCCRSRCSGCGRSAAPRSRPSPSRHRSSPFSSTRRSTCRKSCVCRRSRPAWSTCPRPGACSWPRPPPPGSCTA